MEQDNHLLLTNTFHWKCEECPPRNSHVEFFNNRDWQSVQEFWSHALKALYQRDKNETITASSALPPFIVGDELFSWTSLNRLHMVSMDSGEFDSTDQKFSSRYTYALCIGYDGSKYNGYQQQRGTDPNQIRTVEDDVEFLLRRKVIVAGRTDKDVSAMSQIISFHNHDAADQSDSIIKLIERRMERFDSCLQSGEPYISDDEISQNDNESMTQPEQSMLSKKKSKLQDKMNKKKSSFSYSTPTSSLSGKFRVWDCQRVSRKFHPIFSTLWRRYIFLFPLCPGKYENNVDVDVDFVRRCFARLENQDLPYNGFAHRDNRNTGLGLSDKCQLFRAQASLVYIGAQQQSKAIAVELVGNRFLRRMVRILVATAIRESALPEDLRDEAILYQIAISGDRERASLACPGIGLALCGVGFDMEDLADYKNSSKKRDISGDEYVEGETATNCSNTHSNSTNNPASRRRKVKSSSQNSSQLREPNETSSAIPERNINISVSLYFQTTKQSNSRWKTFRHELTLCDPLLLFYPQRNFTFSFGDILISQSSGCIFSTIWDAEVILAHFLDDSKSSFLQNAITNIVKPSVTCLELGAGCGLAGVVFHRAASALVSDGSVHVIMQEIDEDAVAYCGRCVQEASIGAPVDRLQFSLVASKWGDTTISGVCTLGIDQVDIVLMADVFYHTDHFLDLLITIKVLLRAGGSLMFAFEQRRKDLLTFVQQLVEMFQVVQVHEFLIDKDNQAMDLENAEELDFNPATIFVFTCCNKIQ